MSDAAPIAGAKARTNIPPMGVEAPERVPARATARQPARMFRAPDADQKYHIPEDQRDPNYDYVWHPTKIAGMENKRATMAMHRSGWDFAAASEFPDLSGAGYEFPADMVARGLLDNVNPNEPIEIDDQVLLRRPKELSRAARKRDDEKARDQVVNQMKRLNQAYRPADPRGPGISRRHRPLEDSGSYSDEE